MLANADHPLRYVEVRQEVERSVGGALSGSSVKNALARGASGPSPIYLRVGRGRYQLAERAGRTSRLSDRL